MRVLDRIFPEGIQIPDYFFGKNIVHLPTMKCHIYTTTTGAMKNAFGGLLNTQRHYTHSWIHETLVDLLAIQKEIHSGLFAIMDGTTAGNGPGPRTMYPVIKNVMLASADQVAIDAVAAKMMGFDPMSLEYIRLAHEDGLGVGDPRDIEIVGDATRRRRAGASTSATTGARRRRRPDVVRAAQAVPEAVLPHAARQRVHPRAARSITTTTAGRWATAACSSGGARRPTGASCSCATRRSGPQGRADRRPGSRRIASTRPFPLDPDPNPLDSAGAFPSPEGVPHELRVASRWPRSPHRRRRHLRVRRVRQPR